MLRATLREQEIRQVIEAPGEGDLVVEGVAPVHAAEDRCLCFISKDVPTAVRESLATRNGCIVIVPKGSALVNELGASRVLEAADPRAAMAKVLGFIQAERRQPPLVDVRNISPRAIISPLAVVEGNVSIGDEAVIEPFCTVAPDVVIGRGSILRAGARIYPRVSIGEECDIGANSIVGNPGFGYVRDENGNKVRIPHLGGVRMGSHVDIDPLSGIQGGVIMPTTIEDHVKIGGVVGIAHGAHIARGVSVVAGVIVGGSAVIEMDAWLGIGSTIRDGRRVGARAVVGMDASVQDDLEDDAVARTQRAEIIGGVRSARLRAREGYGR